MSVDEDAPESKCNIVCVFPKPESLAYECRNLLGVSESYICYSVKKTLLRIINTVSTARALLRGHGSYVLDLKFSRVAKSTNVCSVDEGDGEGSHTFIWQINDGAELTSVTVGQFSLRSSIVQPHPTLVNVWAIATNSGDHSKIGFISPSIQAELVKLYEDLPVHIIFEKHETISGMQHRGIGTTCCCFILYIFCRHIIFPGWKVFNGSH